jgi:hypothetical protein
MYLLVPNQTAKLVSTSLTNSNKPEWMSGSIQLAISPDAGRRPVLMGHQSLLGAISTQYLKEVSLTDR